MKSLHVLIFFVVLVELAVGRPTEDKYTDKYDNIDVDEILSSDRLLKNYMICLKEGRRCSPDGLELRKVLPDALKTKCSKCSEKQKEQSTKVIHNLVKNHLKEFKELESIYDPDHQYRILYAEELKKEGIVIPN